MPHEIHLDEPLSATDEAERFIRLQTSGVPSKCWNCHDFLTTIVQEHCEECDTLIPS